MKIRVADGRVLEGTSLQIVQQMQALSFVSEGRPLVEFISDVVARTLSYEGVLLEVPAGAEDEQAAALVMELLRTGLAKRLSS